MMTCARACFAALACFFAVPAIGSGVKEVRGPSDKHNEQG